jgi:hypothetical protein
MNHAFGRKQRAARWRAAVVLSLLLGSAGAGAQAPVSAVANRYFEEGVRHLGTREPDRFEKAYEQFKAAYAESHFWRALGNIGMVAEALERDGEAIEAYRGYLAGGGKQISAAERARFTADQARLELTSALVTLHTEPDGAWIIDERVVEQGRPIVNRYGPSAGPVELRLRPGRHRIHAELSGYTSATWEFEAQPGAQAIHAFELRRANVPSETPASQQQPAFDDRLVASEPSPAARIGGYAALGLGGLGVGVGTWFLIRAFEERREGRAAFDKCIGTPQDPLGCALSGEKTRSERTERIRSLVTYGAAGALLATGTLLLIYAGPRSEQPADEELGLLPWIGPDQLGVAGRF